MARNRQNHQQHRSGHHQAAGNPRHQRTDPLRRRSAPYHFVPVRPDLAITDTPVFHDTQHIEDDYWSGELHCTLTALTPLLCGNDQYEFSKLPEELKNNYKKFLTAKRVDCTSAQAKEKLNEKSVLEPLALLPQKQDGLPGPILIPGTQLKGMLRQSMQALLSAPMERVQQRKFSYRPLLKFSTGDNLLQTRPARVISCEDNAVTIEILEFGHLVYVDPDINSDARSVLEGKCGKKCTSETCLPGCYMTNGRSKKVLNSPNASEELCIEDYMPLQGACGLDGGGTFGEPTEKEKEQLNQNELPKPGYEWVLLSPGSFRRTKIRTMTFNHGIIKAYERSLRQIRDREHGHLRDHPRHHLIEPKNFNAIIKNIDQFLKYGFRVGDLLFVEITDDDPKVITIGRHFRYRMSYRDSIHALIKDYKPDEEGGKLRSVLRPLPCEKPNEDDPKPQSLSAARCLMGYISALEEYQVDEPLCFGIGKDDYQQLAGRIAINFAIESDPAKPASKRFLNAGDGDTGRNCFVPLRPLGSPKASAVEHYLTQTSNLLQKRNDNGILCTYGDTLDDPSAGDLRGRKFYLHQPDAATENGNKCYEAGVRHEEEKEHLATRQATLARFVSCPGTQFRFTVRFRDLRAWELGALLFSLAPDKSRLKVLRDGVGEEAAKKIKDWPEKWKSNGDDGKPLLAHKLGHARPLGLGSVSIKVDKIRRLKFDTSNNKSSGCGIPKARFDDIVDGNLNKIFESAIQALSAKITGQLGEDNKVKEWVENVLMPWLQVHRYAGRTSFDYPSTYPNGSDTPARRGEKCTIFNYHTFLRQQHAAGRKKKSNGQNNREPVGLKSLDELDKDESGS